MRRTLCIASGLAMLLMGASVASAAGAANMATGIPGNRVGTLIEKVHSLYDAKNTLYGLGYYDVRVERASLPYSFNACKRGARYHIHVNYYGDLVQVDRVGYCRQYDYDDNGYDYGYRRHRNHFPRYDY
jgi:opacity protein-like surface antigen